MSKKTTKLKENDILQLPNRRKVYRTVLKYAGSHFREIERKCGLPTGTVKYHLDYLTKHNIIKQEKADGHVRYFPKELSGEEKQLLSFLRPENSRKILIFLISESDASHKEITSFVDLSSSTVSWYLGRLIRGGVINMGEKNKRTVYFLRVKTEMIMRLLIIYKESFLDSLVDRTIETWG